MKKLKISYLSPLVIAFALLFAGSCKQDKDETVPVFEHNFGSFTDSRDGHVYKTIEIGSQTWFAENLAYEGAGKEITDFEGWFLNTTYEGWCYYENNKATYGATYGVLYQWGVASIACPDGWHLPTRTEWALLRDSLGGKYEAGGKLKEAGTTHWHSDNEGATNETGFTALPGGMKGSQPPHFIAIGEYANFWSTKIDSTSATDVSLANWTDIFFISELIGSNKYLGNSVRCLKD